MIQLNGGVGTMQMLLCDLADVAGAVVGFPSPAGPRNDSREANGRTTVGTAVRAPDRCGSTELQAEAGGSGASPGNPEARRIPPEQHRRCCFSGRDAAGPIYGSAWIAVA